jgi:hypothetical protein
MEAELKEQWYKDRVDRTGLTEKFPPPLPAPELQVSRGFRLMCNQLVFVIHMAERENDVLYPAKSASLLLKEQLC